MSNFIQITRKEEGGEKSSAPVIREYSPRTRACEFERMEEGGKKKTKSEKGMTHNDNSELKPKLGLPPPLGFYGTGKKRGKKKRKKREGRRNRKKDLKLARQGRGLCDFRQRGKRKEIERGVGRKGK